MLSGPPLRLPAGELRRLTDQAFAWLAENRGELAAQAAGEASVVAELFAGLALAVFCSLFFLHSGERLWGWVLGQLPVRRRRWDAAGRAGWTAFAGYTRGVVIVAVSNATLVGIALFLLKVPLALPLTPARAARRVHPADRCARSRCGSRRSWRWPAAAR